MAAEPDVPTPAAGRHRRCGLALVVVLSVHFVVHYDTVYETYYDFDRDTYFHR